MSDSASPYPPGGYGATTTGSPYPPANYGHTVVHTDEHHSLGEVLTTTGRFARKEFHKGKELLYRGNFTTWGLAFGAAFLAMFASFWLFWLHMVTLSPINACMQVYFIIFSLLILVLETNPKYLPKGWTQWVQENFKFLTTVKGRGFFYLFFATLLVSEWRLLHIIAGGIFAFNGLVMIWMGHRAGKKLKKAHKEFADENVVKQMFYEADTQKEGFLNATEFATLCETLGSPLTRSELEAAVMILDTNKDNKISFEEFFHWWSSH